MRWITLLAALILAAPAAAQDAPTCEGVEDPAAGAPACRYSPNPEADLLRILEPLRVFSGFHAPLKVYFLDSVPVPNAVAMAANVPPNRENVDKIGLTVGLWDIIQSDDELAFVLAHELAHLAAKDPAYVQRLSAESFDKWSQTKDYRDFEASVMAREGITTDQATAAIVQRFNRLFINARTKEVERHADINAINLMMITDSDGDGQPDYDVSAALSFLERVKQEMPEEENITIDSDHPSVSERMSTIEGVRLFVVDAAYFADQKGSGVRTGKKKGLAKGKVRKLLKDVPRP